MTVVPLDARERDELCDLFLELGPDAPTLCEGWTTADLAAHLVVRERDPLAMPGILVGRFADVTERRMARQRDRPWEALVHAVRDGPPVGPMAIPGLRVAINLPEFFVHHEDVRRANGGGPRRDRLDLDEGLWRLLKRAGRVWAFRLRGAGLEAVRSTTPGGRADVVTVKGGAPRASLEGSPQEIVLYLYGRRSVADVALSGDPRAVARVESTSFGV
jgi:uncharacterized protein (TIGR03085 family)